MSGPRDYLDADIKRLFSFSGNQCSEPNCTRSMIAEDGITVVGKICHIEAASSKGPRFNKDMDDNLRRAYDNLILLCDEHHSIIDNKKNEQKYGKEILLEWKENHVSKFRDTVISVSEEVVKESVKILFIANSEDYYNLLEEIKELREDLQDARTLEKRLKKGVKLEIKEKQLKELKSNVLELYETFAKIDINTERLRLAKEFFDKGEFRKTDAILKVEEISEEVAKLKEAKNNKEEEIAEIDQNLEDKAKELQLKAQLWKTFYTEANWFEKTEEYFKKALDATHNVEIVFEFALFLQIHNQIGKAQSLYEEALKIRRQLVKENPIAYLPYVAKTLNNLANLQRDNNEFPQALENYKEALKIRRQLAKENPKAYLPGVVATLISLAIVQKAKNEFPQALENYEEALKISRQLAKANPKGHEIYYAQVLIMGVQLFKNNEDNLKEARIILNNYPDIFWAQRLLVLIDDLEKNK